MGLEIVSMAVYQDSKQVASILVSKEQVQRLAESQGLPDFQAEVLSYYTCVDGPLLVLGNYDKKITVALALDIKNLKENTVFYNAWNAHKSLRLTQNDVYTALLKVHDNDLN